MTTTKEKHYKVEIAGVGYGAGQVAIKGDVIAVTDEDVERLLALDAISETDEELTHRPEDVPVEHAQELESKEEHKTKVTGGK